MAAEQTTRLWAEEDVHELMLRAYSAGWIGHAHNPDARPDEQLPDPELDDGPATTAVEFLREDYTPRQPITEELFARPFVESLVKRAVEWTRANGRPVPSFAYFTQDLIEAERGERP